MKKVLLVDDYQNIFEKEKENYLQLIPELESFDFRDIYNRELSVIAASELTSETGLKLKTLLIYADTYGKKTIRIPVEMFRGIEGDYDRVKTKEDILGSNRIYTNFSKVLDIILEPDITKDVDLVKAAIHLLNEMQILMEGMNK